ncbi:putative integrase [Selenomonas ruminantium subsp. lactilytica TAM6421]|uniref:Putative integrase n=1 Tax=Selenomonas ruminantium subsp. lactilytica (strain NBRC 103574 / TAM6421) TaxID=927704 RepID=I0GS26_SELRL|nr:recombinase family protein [Selenomonas ruminantium]BAL83563.1 putative integrase [Selenomonas ruminantium subsp. lactilytica TAM6421]
MNAVIYARYSSDNQREESIDAQLRFCHRHCDEKGYNVIHEYIDEAFSATNDNRPAYQQMLKDAAKGGFDVVVFHKVNRNARNEYDYYMNKMKLMRAGVSIEYAGQAFDTQTPEGQLMENQLVGMAAYFSRNLAKEVKKGQNENALKCVHNGGIPPLGYDVDPVTHKYIINEKEAVIVRYLFSAYATGTKYPDIIAECERRGYRTKRGNKFGNNSLHDLFRNKKYIGTYTYGKTRGGHNMPRNSHVEADDMVEIPNGMPAIIDMETWQATQDRIYQRIKKNGAFHSDVNYLLSGLVVCGKCGKSVTGTFYRRAQKDGSKRLHAYYRCEHCNAKQIPKDKLEEYVIKAVKANIRNKRKVEQIVTSINSELKRQNKSIAVEVHNIDSELKSIDKANDNLLGFIEQGQVSEIIATRLKKNAERSAILRARLTELKKQEQNALDVDSVREVLQAWQAVKDEKGLSAMIHSFVSRVVLYEDKVDIDMFIGMDGVHYHTDRLLSSTPISSKKA